MVSVFLNLLFLVLLLLPALYVDASRVSADKVETCVSCGDHESPKGPEDNVFLQFYGNYYSPFLMRTPVRVAVLVIFGLFFGLLAWQGFEETDAGVSVSTECYV